MPACPSSFLTEVRPIIPRFIQFVTTFIAQKFRGWTRDGMRARYEHRLNADKNSPQPGDIAPDFSLEILNQTGARTGEMLSLSSLRGKPVGLIFGSYT